MDKNKKIIVGIMAVMVVVVVIIAYLFIEGHEGHHPPFDFSEETKPIGNITITSEMGIWKPDREAEKKAVEKFGKDVFPNCSNCKADIILIGGYSAPIMRAERAMRRGGLRLPHKENITKEEAKNIAINIISKHPDFFCTTFDNVEINKVEKITYLKFNKYEVYFKPQTYKNIHFCDHSDSLGLISLDTDGSLEYLWWYYYQNVSVPTGPKLTEQEAIKILSQKFGVAENKVEIEDYPKEPCIFPLYHKDKDFWSYHLAREFRVFTKDGGTIYLDMTTGDILFIKSPII